MARTINRLSHRKVETLKEPGMHSDGGGLYLQVTQGSDRTPQVLAFQVRGGGP